MAGRKNAKLLLVVLDTNALISHLWGSHTMRLIMAAMRDNRFTPVISDPLLAEFKNVVARPRIAKVIGQFAPRVFIRELLIFAHHVTPTTRVTKCADPDDDMVLECALEAKAECIVSGDSHLLSLVSFEGIPILPPAAFVQTILQRD